MKKRKKQLIQRLFTVVLSVLMVVSLLPLSVTTAQAAAEEQPYNDITDVVIEGKQLSYNGEEQELVTVDEKEGDIVSYKINGGESIDRAVGINAGTYSIEVTVYREGMNDLVKTVTSTISPAKINVTFEAINPEYNGADQELASVKGSENIPQGSTVTWFLNEEEYSQDISSVPKASAVGEYQVKLHIEAVGNANYEIYEEEQAVSLQLGTIDTTGFKVENLNGVYTVNEDGNAVPQKLVKTKVQPGYEYNFKYQLDDDDGQVDQGAWIDEVPTATNAGSYNVWIKVVKENYRDSDPVLYHAFIDKAEQKLKFTEPAGSSTTVEGKRSEFPKTMQFTAEDETKVGGVLTYSVELAEDYEGSSEDRKITIEDMASIDPESGLLTMTNYGGKVLVKATLSETENYKECVIEHPVTIIVKEDYDGQFVRFDTKEIEYILGTNAGITPFNNAVLQNEGRGKLAYSIKNGEKYGLRIYEKKNGLFVPADYAVEIVDYQALTKALTEAGGELSVEVVCKKNQFLWQGDSYASYNLKIKFADTPENPYVIEQKPNAAGWYKEAVKIAPTDKDAYEIAKNIDEKATKFGAETSYDNEGTGKRYVYLRNKTEGAEKGGITDRILLENIKIDTTAPAAGNMKIDIRNLSLIDKLGVKFGFFNPLVDIEFVISDETISETGVEESGIDYIEWIYEKDKESPVDAILAKKTGTIEKKDIRFEDGRYIGSLTIKADELEQYRGHIAFRASDIAGNESEIVTKDDVVVVVDTISPTMKADFKVADEEHGIHTEDKVDGAVQHYFNGDVDFTFTVKEANFFSEDIAVRILKDGESYKEPEDLKDVWSEEESEEDKKKGIHHGKFTLSKDGDYVVQLTYNGGKGDQSGNTLVDADDPQNQIVTYTSEVLTIDTVKPEVDFTFDREEQKTIFKVKEHNFRSKDIHVTGNIQDINGNVVEDITAQDIENALHDEEKWLHVSGTDIYTYEYFPPVSGIYDLKINYTDISQNTAAECEPETFIIDHDGPTGLKIEYSKSILDTVLETATFGFYNPDVKVTFAAFDTASGVENFIWSYTKEDGASDINRPTDNEEKIGTQVIKAEQDPKDKSKFTAQTTLSANEAEQLRGYISVLATDNYKNRSDKFTDEGYVLVVDTVSPTMTVDYSKESRMVGTTAYYNKDVNVTFTVNEANFFAEDVKVTVSKDGGTPYPVEPVWSDENADIHVGTRTLSGDGDYIVRIEYMDRSTNKMASYQSDIITIDTIAPVIDVRYENNNRINTLKDRDGNDRAYYSDMQTVVLTVTEHNFNEEEVDFSIIAKDIAGRELDTAALHEKSAWNTDSTGDVHTLTITYPGDANYTFDVAYADLATNKAEDYATDYFTVDKTIPTNLQVSYSTSVLETVLDTLSFGFYNARMKVTITAEDNISGVHDFNYSYVKAAGVSSVNAELLDQAVAETEIQYPENGEKASKTFEIPKEVLKADNQFNGSIEFTATDRSSNKTGVKDSKRIVVDNISPTAHVSYNDATNVAGNISYYNGDIHAAVRINEANFYPGDVQVMISKNRGTAYGVTPSWSNNSVDVHIGTFTLTGDGDYVVIINYRDKSSNAMSTYTSQQMTIDTEIKEPAYKINGVDKKEDGGAYKRDAKIEYHFEDQNFEAQTVKLTRTRFDSEEDVTDKFIKTSNTDKGGSGSFAIPSKVENDGIYLLTVEITDKAKHKAESKMKFTINRYGSVYEYDDYLVSLIEDGGQYVKSEGNDKPAITKDLVITEYNANQLLNDSLKILITRDGEIVDAEYTASPTINDKVKVGESGWYQYKYTIDKENFAQDGVYRITLASAYAASDSKENESSSVPENSIDADGNKIVDTMNFTVDTTAPEIRNVVNLDKAIVNAQSLNVDYTIVDVGGLKSVEVIVNGEQVDQITDFKDSAFNYSGQFTIRESSEKQTVQLKVTDLAGNVTDTAAKNFSTNDLYIFNDKITVSTNFFVRWYANKPLFWGTVGSVAALAGGICLFITYRRKKKQEELELSQ